MDMSSDHLARLAVEIEESLRREGLEDWMICGLLGAALVGGRGVVSVMIGANLVWRPTTTTVTTRTRRSTLPAVHLLAKTFWPPISLHRDRRFR